MHEKIPIMKLGVVKEIVEATGMGISYAYEDLVFLDHNALLLQFTQDSDTVLVHTNREAATEPAQATIAALKQAGQEKEMTFLDGQIYALTQGKDEQVNIEFIPLHNNIRIGINQISKEGGSDGKKRR